jgi:hypothetical protein
MVYRYNHKEQELKAFNHKFETLFRMMAEKTAAVYLTQNAEVDTTSLLKVSLRLHRGCRNTQLLLK